MKPKKIPGALKLCSLTTQTKQSISTERHLIRKKETKRSTNHHHSTVGVASNREGDECTSSRHHGRNAGHNKTAAILHTCSGCNKLIKREKYLLSACDKFWHESCLKCDQCHAKLGELGSSLFAKSDMILCRQDFLDLFGPSCLCAVCEKLIRASEMVMRAKHNVYHLECFACQLCNQRFCVGDQFYLLENKVICQYDFEDIQRSVAVGGQETLTMTVAIEQQQQQQQQHIYNTTTTSPSLKQDGTTDDRAPEAAVIPPYQFHLLPPGAASDDSHDKPSPVAISDHHGDAQCNDLGPTYQELTTTAGLTNEQSQASDERTAARIASDQNDEPAVSAAVGQEVSASPRNAPSALLDDEVA